MARSAREFLTKSTEPSLLRDIPAENITSKDVYDAAVKGDKIAQDIFEFTGTILGEALADFIAFSSPEAIVLFGGLAKAGDYIFKPIQKAIDDNVLDVYKRQPYKASVHTHPIELVAMTHNKKFLEKDVASNLLWSMIPETKAFCPRGLGIIPYQLPSSVELAEATIRELDDYDVCLLYTSRCV